MKFMSPWSFPNGVLPEATERFLAGEAAPEPGVTLLGRWHKVDCSGGFFLFESNDPSALYKGAAKWSDLLEFSTVPVVEDQEAGVILASVFKKQR